MKSTKIFEICPNFRAGRRHLEKFLFPCCGGGNFPPSSEKSAGMPAELNPVSQPAFQIPKIAASLMFTSINT